MLVCLFSLAAPAAAYSGFQDFLNATGRLKGVNYNRIRQDTKQSMHVRFEIGTKSFHGVLKKGYRLEDAEADGIIKSVMLELGLNTAALTIHETQIASAEKRDPAFKTQFWLEMIGQFIGAGDAMAKLDLATGKISGTQYLMGQVESKLLSEGTAAFIENAALGPVGGFIVNGLANCAKPAAQEVLKAFQNDAAKQKAIESAATLNAFYQRCNQRLKQEAEKKDKTGWQLVATNQKAQEIRTFFGAPVVQNWTLNCCLLKEEDTAEPGGLYTGFMTVDITHDMTKFDGKFLWQVANTLPVLPEIHEKMPWQSFTDCWQRSSILEKHLYAKEISLVVPSGVRDLLNGSFMDDLILSMDFKSKEDFWSLHPIWLVPDGVMPMLNKEGRYSLPYTEGQAATVLYLMGEMADDGMSPRIYAMSSSMKLWSETNAPQGAHWSFDDSLTSGGGVLAVNHDIYRDLEENRVVLRYGWKEEQG